MQMETEWVKRPVIRLDMSRAGAAPESVRSYLDNAFHQLESEYDIVVRQDSSLADRFDAIIQTAYNKTGLQVTNTRSLSSSQVSPSLRKSLSSLYSTI